MTKTEFAEIIEAAKMELDTMSDHDPDSDVEKAIGGLALLQEWAATDGCWSEYAGG